MIGASAGAIGAPPAAIGATADGRAERWRNPGNRAKIYKNVVGIFAAEVVKINLDRTGSTRPGAVLFVSQGFYGVHLRRGHRGI